MVLSNFSLKRNISLFLKIKNHLIKKDVHYSFRNRDKRGQASVEMVLLLSIFLFVATFISTVLRESEVAERIIGRPWKVVSGMIESGTWEENASNDQHPFHPVTSSGRHLSVKGQNVQ